VAVIQNETLDSTAFSNVAVFLCLSSAILSFSLCFSNNFSGVNHGELFTFCLSCSE
jgi:hypothetical protein